MRNYGAMTGFVAVSKTRFTQTAKTSGNILKKKTTTVTGLVKPEWYVVTPVDVQPEGTFIESICVIASATCDAPEHVAYSGVAFALWTGGNMPANEEAVYSWAETKSAWTVLAFALILGPLLVAASPVMMLLGLNFGGLLAVLGPLGYAMAYGGDGLTAPQSKPFGDTGSGVLAPDYGSMSTQELGVAQSVDNRHVKPVQGYNLTGSTQLYKGACPGEKTVKECNALSLDPGTMWRGDSYQEVNMTLEMRTKFNSAACAALTGPARMECAAPVVQ